MEVNINREVEDTFYRYKMPKLTAKVEGKGNGIKTVIVNVMDIAKALYRKPIYVTKFFGCELGAQVYVDEKNDRYIVNGAHEAAKLQELLDGFIKKFVLCQECGNPETSLRVKKRAGIVATTCKACGAQGHLDIGHRLTQFIIKNPPDGDNTTSGKSKSKKGKKNGEHDSGEEEATNGEENSQHSPNFAEDRDDQYDDWGEDTTEEAQLERMNALSSMAKSLAVSVDVQKTETERADVFLQYLLDIHKQGNACDKRREIRDMAEQLELGPRVILVIAEVLLSSSKTILEDIKIYRLIFMTFTRNGDNSKRAQQYLLRAMTKLIEKFSADNLVKRSCHILNQLYDCDIVEEDSIIAWYNKGPSKKYIPKELCSKIMSNCTPMIKWLQEAEVEGSDDDGEDDVEEEETKEQAPVDVISPLKKVNGTDKVERNDTGEGDDEIDIDAI